MNLLEMLKNTARQYADKTAIVLGEQRLSYAELDEASSKVANALMGLKVQKGDRVAMLLPNSPEFAIICLGIIKAGGIAVPLDIRYHVDELASLFANCKPKVLVSENPFLEPIVPALSRFDSIEHIIDLGSSYKDKMLSYSEIITTYSAEDVAADLTPDDIGIISYTGGPTNQPHGVAISCRNLAAEINISVDGFQQTAKDVIMLFALPMFHMFGMTAVLLGSISKGSTIILVPGTGISINSLMEAIESEGGTILLGVPYIYALAVMMAKREGIKSDLSSLRLCVSGGAPLPINTIRQFKEYYGLTLVDIWGLTEAVCHVTSQPIDGTGKLGASGKALPGWEMKIVDDNDTELPPNKSGEIIVRGPIMDGYYDNPQATAKVIKNGWLYTGDIGKIDKTGYLYITGRKKRMIILKGQNIYHDDIEAVLRTHPKIAETRVVGIPDKLRGEIVGAYIILKAGEVATDQEIRHFCHERMSDFKIPKQIIFTDTLPEMAAVNIF